VCLLHAGKHLFSGDHVAWSDALAQVYAFRRACWYDWRVQIESMKRLARHDFEWILPGHGRRCRFPKPEMRAQMARAVAWMADR
jgi:glyoxylase-like metal-dependent hydrolase (beta-lactamase superfamily II)